MLDTDLEMLRRIDPEGGEPSRDRRRGPRSGLGGGSGDRIVDEHNRRADPRAAQDAIGPAQRLALELLRDPTVILPADLALVDRAAKALTSERSSAVRRRINEIRDDVQQERISRDAAAERIVTVVDEFGLQPVPEEELPRPIEADDLGVVCWMAVLPAS